MAKKLDHIDYKILSLLSEDAQMAYTEVAKRSNISGGTVHMRMKKMRELGIIKGTTLSMDYSKIGWNLTVFIFIYLTKSSNYKNVIENLKTIPEVVKVHHITGKYGIFLKVHSRDTDHFRKVYQEKILTIEGVEMTESFISLEENLNRHILFEGD